MTGRRRTGPGPLRRLADAVVPPWMNRNMRLILGTRMAMSVGRAVLSIVTALYLAALGFSGLKIGTLFVAVTFASALMSSAVGFLSDRVGRKPFLVAVPLIAAAASAVYATTTATAVLFVAAAFGSFGRGAGAGGGNVGPYQPAESAFIAEDVPTGYRVEAFGRVAFTSVLGGLAGGLMAQLVHAGPHIGAPAALGAYRPAFVAAAVLFFVAGVLALGLRDPTPHRPHRSVSGPRLRWPKRSWPALWRLWITNGTNGVAMGLYGPFMSYWMYRRYGVGAGQIGILFAVVNVGSLAATVLAPAIGNRFGTVRAIVAVRMAGGLLILPMVLAPNFWAAGAAYFFRMLAQRVGMPLRLSFVQDMADPSERATVAALANLPAQVTMAGGQTMAGYLFDEVSLSAPFEIASVFQCINAALYGLLFALRPPAAVTGVAPADPRGPGRREAAPAPGGEPAPAPGGEPAPGPAPAPGGGPAPGGEHPKVEAP
ncbi:MAG TPA: MFS transporter [Acidimicrobiales bacterium]|nr:MFS transporter [Acidimicrobiales bacterium]